MRADDDGFVSPRAVMRMVGSSEDELKVLISKRFLIPFETGVLVIKHWRINNRIRLDWYKPTMYTQERDSLYIKENGAYTLDSKQGGKLGTEMVPVRSRSIVQYSIDKIPANAVSLELVKEDSDSKEYSGDSKSPKLTESKKKAYDELIAWSEKERDFKFPKTAKLKQYRAFKIANQNEIPRAHLVERWEEMSGDKFWQGAGFDWMNVVQSLLKKPV